MTAVRPRWTVVLFCILMVTAATVTDAAMDELATHYDNSVFAHWPGHQQWLDPRISWKNKWKNGDPHQGPAFPLSTTSLVALTDAWHFFKTCTITFVVLAVLAPFTQLVRLPWFAWIGIYCGVTLLYGLVFETCYAWLFLK